MKNLPITIQIDFHGQWIDHRTIATREEAEAWISKQPKPAQWRIK